MTELLKCTECRGVVSSSAKKCPHCNTINFRDKNCAICKTPVIAYQSQQYVSPYIDYDDPDHKNIILAGSYPSGYGERRRFYCNSCWKRLKEIDVISHPPETLLRCQLCENQISVDYDRNNQLVKAGGNYTCSNCGHSNTTELSIHKVSNCHICHMLLDEKKEVRVNILLHPRGDKFIHRICYTPEVKRDVEDREKVEEESRVAWETYTVRAKREREAKERDEKRQEIYSEYVMWAMFIGVIIGFLSAGFTGLILGPFIGNILWRLFTILMK
jgi:hypothetical protein